MKEIVLDITLALSGPVITAATEAGAFGVDMPFAKDENQSFYLPGSQVKGRLRESLETIVPFMDDISPSDIDQWFGKGADKEGDWAPGRGRLIFEDYTVEGGMEDNLRTRIRMDPERGAVAKGAYLVMESPFKSGETVEFKGRIRFVSIDDNETTRVTAALQKGLRWAPAFGGQRSVGFGRLASVHIEQKEKAVPLPTDKPSGSACEELTVHMNPCSPFCVAKGGKSEYLFEADTIIPGGAVKGCIAATLNYILGRSPDTPLDSSLPAPWNEIGKHFPVIRFDHAFPAIENQARRPRQYPLSLVQVDEAKEGNRIKAIYDVALCREPGLIRGKAPIFPIDWKYSDRQAFKKEFDWKEDPQTLLRVRTAMDSETGRAEEGQLFAYEMINPAGFLWIGRADLGNVPKTDRGSVRAQLEALREFGLRFLGKTKADVKFSVMDAASMPVPVPLDDDQWIFTLQTPAMMIPPDANLNKALVDQQVLFDAYAAFWSEISGENLQLVRFFAHQRLMGNYLFHRFQKDKAYNPFLLTAEQSVFILESNGAASTEEIAKQVLRWLKKGLPLPKWSIERYGENGAISWSNCPFVRENGFGEIAVNMECHKERKPDPDDYKEIA